MIGTLQSNEARSRSGRPMWSDWLSRKFWFLDADGLCEAARHKTGHYDFGDPPIQPGLSILTESLEREAELRPFGRFLMRVHLRDLLETRLRLTALWKHQGAELDSVPLQRPIFVTGMPRSGSTFLHELLAEDPNLRAPRVWEVMFPVPIAGSSSANDPRIRRGEACLWWFRRLVPEADAVFPMRARTPHECVAIHSYTFLSEEFISTCRIPGYESYLRQADLRPAYAWERRFLQHLQFQSRQRQWVLKSPDHVYGLEALFATFPDALIVQTHRNPIDVLKSSCHLTEALHGLYGRPGPAEQRLEHETRTLADTANRFLNFRDQHPELGGRFVDVKYDEIIANPVALVRRIYDQFGMELTSEAAGRMQQLAVRRSRYTGSSARNTAPDARLRALAEASCFERYCSRFNVGWQQTP
jgi:hypothetical protein